MKRTLADIGLAVGSGLLTALAFPKFNLAFLAWISLIPLFSIIFRSSPKRSFWFGLLAGLSFYGLLLYWIPAVPAHYGGLSPAFSLLVDIVLVLFLALFWAVSCLIISKVNGRWPFLGFILAPFIWVAQEYGLTYIFSGFPWGLLGYSQQANLWLIQAATVAGVYGVSWILIFFQSSFIYSFRSKRRIPFAVGLAVMVLAHTAGLISMGRPQPASDSFRAAVIQGNVSSDIAWGQVPLSFTQRLFEKHLDLTRRAAKEGAQLIIWPEFSVPMCFSCSDPLPLSFKHKLLNYVRRTGRSLLVGTTEVSSQEEKTEYYNSALGLQPNLPVTEYHKMHLVPFGEYTPFPGLFGFVKRMTQAIGEVTPGLNTTLHKFGQLRFGSPICYEIIFPDLVRRFVKNGADFLVTITNDGWYGPTSAPHQHFAIAVFRAVENRRFLLRAATTGVSGIIDPWGRVVQRSKIMTEAFLTGTVTPGRDQTIYSRYGDVFSWVSLTLTLIAFILAFFFGTHDRQRKKTYRKIY
ncbi:MAG TPA: apolipoprotein N-acyltransferase [Acidobacteriota bacterium]